MKNGWNLACWDLKGNTESTDMNTRDVGDTNWYQIPNCGTLQCLTETSEKKADSTRFLVPLRWRWQKTRQEDKRESSASPQTIATAGKSKEHSKIAEMLGGRQLKIYRILDWNMRDGERRSYGASWKQKLGTIWNSVDPQYMSEYKKGYLQAHFYTTGEKQQHKIHVNTLSSINRIP